LIKEKSKNNNSIASQKRGGSPKYYKSVNKSVRRINSNFKGVLMNHAKSENRFQGNRSLKVKKTKTVVISDEFLVSKKSFQNQKSQILKKPKPRSSAQKINKYFMKTSLLKLPKTSEKILKKVDFYYSPY